YARTEISTTRTPASGSPITIHPASTARSTLPGTHGAVTRPDRPSGCWRVGRPCDTIAGRPKGAAAMPLQKDVQIVSVDDHVIEHRNVWQDRLPERFKEAGPRNFRDDKGDDVWEFEGRRTYSIGISAVAGKPREEFSRDPTRYDDMIPGCYDPQARVKDMDIDGVQAQLCFPSFPGFCGRTFYEATDKELATACVVAYNDWMIDEWCAANPSRQIPLCLVPFWD